MWGVMGKANVIFFFDKQNVLGKKMPKWGQAL